MSITPVRLLIASLAVTLLIPATVRGDDPQTVDHFVLIDSSLDEAVAGHDPIEDDAQVYLGAAEAFSFVAVTLPDRVGSVRLVLSDEDGAIYERTENSPPYALFGDFNGNFNSLWPDGGPVSGVAYTITATPFSRRRGQGTAGESVSISVSFTSEAPPVVCTSDEDCDDDIACTLDTCDGDTNACNHAPQNDLCDNEQFCDGIETCDQSSGCQAGESPCAADLCDESQDTCVACMSDDDCSDGLFCNGEESCSDGSCLPGSEPCSVDEECDEVTQQCETSTFAVTGFVMVNAETDEPMINPMNGGESINLANLASVSMVALTNPENVGSVHLELVRDGEVIYERTENTPPYALFGDFSGNYNLWPDGGPQPGQYQLMAIPFTNRNQGGDSGQPLEVSWTFTMEAEPDCTGDDDCDDGKFCNGSERCVGGLCVAGDTPCESGMTCDDATDQCVSGCTASGCNDGIYCNGIEQCINGACGPGIPPCGDGPCNEALSICDQTTSSISGFTLVNASNNQPIFFYDPLADGTLLDIELLPPLNVRANTQSEGIGSIVFQLRRDGQLETERIENTAPYALFGDSGGNYNPWPGGGPVAGSHYHLTGTAYGGANGSGENLGGVTIAFSFFVPPDCDSDGECNDGLFCNGTEVCNQGQCYPGIPPCGSGQVCSEETDACVIEEQDPEPPVVPACRRNSECDDRLFCNGLEQCIEGQCLSGSAPCGPSEICVENEEACIQLEGRILFVDDNGAQQPGHDPQAEQGSENNPYDLIQDAIDIAQPGDTILLQEGDYDSGTTRRATPVIKLHASGLAGEPISIRAAEGAEVVIHGQNGTTDILVDLNGSHITLEDIEFTNARRAAVVMGQNSSHITLRRCYAHHNDYDSAWIGAAFRTIGPVRHILFEECISHNNSGGFQLRESPTQTAGSASVPPVAGNSGHSVDLPESQWDNWDGWTDIAPRWVTIRRCIAFDNALIDEHSDGFGARYAIQCVFEDNIAFRNTDDGFDLLGATRCTARGNIAFDANPYDTVNGDGNGIKIGVRGGLENVAYFNISFDNPRGGLDLADTERPVVINNTAFNNRDWFGIWTEAGRSSIGGDFRNNISVNNPKGDMGFNGSVAVHRNNHNLMSDDNSHNWSRDGANNLIGAEPQFLNENLQIDTDFPAGLTIKQKHEFIRAQVYEKLGLETSSPAVDTAEIVEDMNEDFAGEAPDRGAVESN